MKLLKYAITLGSFLLAVVLAPGAQAGNALKSGPVPGPYDGIYRIIEADGAPGDFVSVHASGGGDSVIATIYRSTAPANAPGFALADGGAPVATLTRWGSWDLFSSSQTGSQVTLTGYSQYGLCSARVSISFGPANSIRVAPTGLSDLAPAGAPASACNPSLGYWPTLRMERQWTTPANATVDGIYRITNKNGSPGDYLSVHTDASGGVIATIYRSASPAAAQGFDLSDGGSPVATLIRWGSWDLYSGTLAGNVATLTGYLGYGLCKASGAIDFNPPQTIQIAPAGPSEFAPAGPQPSCSGAGDGPLAITREDGGAPGPGPGPGPGSYPLALTVSSHGSVSDDAGKINHCAAATCNASYDSGSAVTLTAVPDAGYDVTWSGACVPVTGFPLKASVSMTGSQSCTATFAVPAATTYPLALTVSSHGSVSDDAGKINHCAAATCNASYDAGSAVTLTAVPDAGYDVTWSGACVPVSGFPLKASVSMTGSQSCAATFAAAGSSMRDITALAATHEMGVGWNLGNTFDATCDDTQAWCDYDPETAWLDLNPATGQRLLTTQAMIDKVAAAGFNVMRVPVTWDTGYGIYHRIGGAPDYAIKPEFLDRLETVVKWGLDNGMYVIINTHHERWVKLTDANYSVESDKLAKIWNQIAIHFRDYNEKLVFETLNEPRYTDAHDENSDWTGKPEYYANLNKLNQLVVNTVRATGGNNAKRFISVPTYAADADTSAILNAFTLPTDSAANKLIVALHDYFPHDFALEDEFTGIDGAGNLIPNPDSISVWGTPAQQTAMTGLFAQINAQFTSKGIPVIMGEFGAQIKTGNDSARKAWATAYVSAAKTYGIPALVWDNDKFGPPESGSLYGILDRATLTFPNPPYLQGLMGAP